MAEGDIYLVADCGCSDAESAPQDAAFIVRAVNAHQSLVEALKALEKTAADELFRLDGSLAVGRYPLRDALEQARAAIAKAAS